MSRLIVPESTKSRFSSSSSRTEKPRCSYSGLFHGISANVVRVIAPSHSPPATHGDGTSV
jgi:hypothetical protein